jgi:hypothetical protein
MLSEIFGQGSYEVPVVQPVQFESMPQDQQIEIIERAIYGDLRGKVPLSPRDLNMYREYVLSHKGYVSSVQQQPAQQNYGATPSLRSYDTYNSAPNYNTAQQPYNVGANYYNPYSQQNYYGSMNSYGYYGTVEEDPTMAGYDPISKYVLSEIEQHNAYEDSGYNYGGQYGSYYSGGYDRPRDTETVRIDEPRNPMAPLPMNPNTDSQFKYENIFNAPIEHNFNITIPEQNPEPIYAEVPVMYPTYNSYGYGYNGYSYNLPPYAYTQSFRDYQNKKYQKYMDVQNSIMNAGFAITGRDYEEWAQAQRAAQQQIQKEQYEAIHKDDWRYTESKLKEVRVYEEKNRANFEKAWRIHYTPEGVRYDPQADWSNAFRVINSSPLFRRLDQLIRPDSTTIEYTRALGQLEIEDTVAKMRRRNRLYSAQNYNQDLYRRQIAMGSNEHKYAYLGFKKTYDPVTGQQITTVSPPDAIKQKYEARKAAYQASAEARGGLTYVPPG